MIVFDTTFLTLMFVPEAKHPLPDARVRVEYLISDIHGSGDRIVIPTPALSEILIKSGKARNEIIQELSRSNKFIIAPFDMRAALELSLMTDAAVRRKDKKDGSPETWAKVKFDRQIVAIAKTLSAQKIYSDDVRLRAVAAREGVCTLAVEDIIIPTPPQAGFWTPQQ